MEQDHGTSPQRDFLLGRVEQTLDMTIVEVQQRLALEGGMKASVGTIGTFSTVAANVQKKTAQAARRDRPNIVKRREAGTEVTQAAAEGTSEVGQAVVASTLTTVAVFLPVIFLRGVAAQLFRDMALTVSFSLLAALAVSLTLIPVLSAVRPGSNTAEDSTGLLIK